MEGGSIASLMRGILERVLSSGSVYESEEITARIIDLDGIKLVIAEGNGKMENYQLAFGGITRYTVMKIAEYIAGKVEGSVLEDTGRFGGIILGNYVIYLNGGWVDKIIGEKNGQPILKNAVIYAGNTPFVNADFINEWKSIRNYLVRIEEVLMKEKESIIEYARKELEEYVARVIKEDIEKMKSLFY